MTKTSISAFSEPAVIAELTSHLERNNVSAVEIQAPDGQLKIVALPGRQGAVSQPNPVSSAALTQNRQAVLARAPIAGLFLPTHPQRPDRAVQPGKSVAQGEVLGFIKVGPVLASIVADKAGIVGEVLAEADALVGYGTPLFKAKA